MKISVVLIPHVEQRYPTCGDWTYDKEGLKVSVSDCSDPRVDACIAVHEIVEALICKFKGVTQQMVDRFDMEYEEERKMGRVNGEPGDDRDAPYYSAHQVATAVERLLAREIYLNWEEYEKKVGNL
jgi:hypothetical protein